MRSWASRTALAAALAVAAWPVIGQEAPESILPPGFDDPSSQPVQPTPPAPAPVAPPPAPPPAPSTPASDAAPDAGASVPNDMPPAPVADLTSVGWLTPVAGGYRSDSFAGSNGLFLTGLMRRIDAPIASRWGQIVLRRALLSVVPTPAPVRPADWIAERAWLLLRLGEVDGAKRLVDAVPVDRYTTHLYAVASQVHLAAADIPALCPLGPTAVAISRDPLWELVNAMCAGIQGDDISATEIFDRLRAQGKANLFDIQLAERIASMASGSARTANVEWTDVKLLNTYRFGLAGAAGVAIPQRLLDKAPLAMRGWLLRTPAASIEARLAAAPVAAALGVSSADELVKLQSARAETLDPFALDAAPAGQLRTAYVGRTPAERLTALRALWRLGSSEPERYAARILTAHAAARIPVAADQSQAAPDLVGSMLTAGLVQEALRWWPITEARDDVRDATWAQLVLADDKGLVAATPERFEAWYAAETARGAVRAKRRAQLLLAALDGLGRTQGQDWSDVRRTVGLTPLANAYTRRLDAAAADRRLGEVAILAATGLQAPNWASIAPQHLARILAAYRRVGLRGEARMMAVEALARS